MSPKSSKITVTKEKESRKTKSEEKERWRRAKINGCLLVFFSGWLLWRVIFGRKKPLDAKGPFGDKVLKNPARCMYVCVFMCLCVYVYVWVYVFIMYVRRGGSRIFFRRGCTRLLLYFNTNKPHSFFLQNTSRIREPQVISGEGGGVRTPCTLPLDPPLVRKPRRVFRLPTSDFRLQT